MDNSQISTQKMRTLDVKEKLKTFLTLSNLDKKSWHKLQLINSVYEFLWNLDNGTSSKNQTLWDHHKRQDWKNYRLERSGSSGSTPMMWLSFWWSCLLKINLGSPESHWENLVFRKTFFNLFFFLCNWKKCNEKL